jgi:hypothetical protein
MKKIYALLFSTISFFAAAFSQTAFTPGNVVVLRVGDGSAALNTAANPVFLDEYSTTTGLLVQSAAMPTSVNGNNRRLTLSGFATSEGALSLSPNRAFLCLAGYDTTVGTSGVASIASLSKTVAIVNAAGVVNTETGILRSSGFNGGNIRGAVTNDGTGVWASGSGSSNSGGSYYVPAGAQTSTPVKVSTAPTNTRAINIYGGQLYTTSASTNYNGVSEVGTGLPTTSGNATTLLPGFPGTSASNSPYAFVMFDLDANEVGLDVAYVADDVLAKGIIKYSKVGGTWVEQGNLTAAKALRGITLINACGKIRGFATTEDSVYAFVDNAGYNQTLNGSLTNLVGKSTNTVFRGVAFAPGTIDPTGFTANATNVKDASCFNVANGEASINVVGGVGSLTYAWSDNGSGSSRTNLAEGVYSVTVADQLGCTAVVTNISIQEPTALTVTIAKQNVSCYGLSDGGLTAGANGGSPTYQYTWNSGNGSNLAAGIYTLTVTDSKGCTVVKSDTLLQPDLLAISSVKGNVTCGSNNNGFINTSTTGGNGGNTFLWDDAATDSTRNNLTAGEYSVTVTDSKGCTAAKADTIYQSNDLNVAGVATNVLCYGASTGAIDITATGGTNTYTYDWGGSVTDEDRINLAAGVFNVTVTDNGGCTGTAAFTLSQPDSLSLSSVATTVSCYGGADGSIVLTTTGGTPQYTYTWSGGLSGANPGNVAAGSYNVTVNDGNACSKVLAVTVVQPDSLSVSGVVTDVTSFGATNGAINVSVTGGTPNYDYDWGNNVVTEDRNNLAAGVYTVSVTDDKGCTKTKSFDVSQPSSLNEIGEIIWVQNLGIENGNMHFAIKTERTSDVQITMVATNGQLVQTQKLQQVNNQMVTLDVSEVSSGVYIVRFDVAGESVAKRVAIAK